MVSQKERVSASFVILQQMVSPCGLIAVLPPIFRMVTLFRMVTFIPAHRSEVYALMKKYARDGNGPAPNVCSTSHNHRVPNGATSWTCETCPQIYTRHRYSVTDRPTFLTCLHIPFTPMRISVGCCAITIRLSSFKLNISVF